MRYFLKVFENSSFYGEKIEHSEMNESYKNKDIDIFKFQYDDLS